jgi:hypothetical protein
VSHVGAPRCRTLAARLSVARMALTTALPETFTRAVAALRGISPRAEIALEEVPAPGKLAPYSFALGATVLRDGEEVTTGRLILLHDPAGHEAWQGVTRLVAYLTTELEADLANDPLLPQVGWSWLVDALDTHTAGYLAIGGTVTQTTSCRFGALSGPPIETDLEMRASWTPLGEMEDHLAAWCALLTSTAGLPPVGVASLPLRHG